MKGDIIYLICCVLPDGCEIVGTIHATKEGAALKMQQILDKYRRQEGFSVSPEFPGEDAGFYVDGPNGFHRFYQVVARRLQD